MIIECPRLLLVDSLLWRRLWLWLSFASRFLWKFVCACEVLVLLVPLLLMVVLLVLGLLLIVLLALVLLGWLLAW